MHCVTAWVRPRGSMLFTPFDVRDDDPVVSLVDNLPRDTICHPCGRPKSDLNLVERNHLSQHHGFMVEWAEHKVVSFRGIFLAEKRPGVTNITP
jgi:hypothetical protein